MSNEVENRILVLLDKKATNQISEAELIELKKSLKENNEILDFSAELNESVKESLLTPEVDEKGAWEKIAHTIATNKAKENERSTRVKWRTLVASFLVFIVSAAILTYLINGNENHEVTASTNEKVLPDSKAQIENNQETPETKSFISGSAEKEIILPDNSEIKLSPNSELAYVDNGQERLVTFSGEGYFEISKNSEKPFVIETGDTRVKVVGTAFLLRSLNEEESTTIEVTEGVVEFSAINAKEKDKITLVKGDKGNYNKKSKGLLKNGLNVDNIVDKIEDGIDQTKESLKSGVDKLKNKIQSKK